MHMNWSRLLQAVGGIGLLVGAIDPMEGSLAILPGSGLIALGTYLEGKDKRQIWFRLALFFLIAIGVGALWSFSALGGIGGGTGRSIWWGLLILPYLVGWTLSVWGPGSPQWQMGLGMCVGFWYMVLTGMLLVRVRVGTDAFAALIPVVVGLLGLVTIAGCAVGLIRAGRAVEKST